MKGRGMTWTLEGAQHILQLRAAIMGSRYACDHPTLTTRPSQPAEVLAAA